MKITFEIEMTINGTKAKAGCECDTYEELNEVRHTLLNACKFAINDAKNVNNTNTAAPAQPQAHIKQDGPMTQKQYNYLIKLGYQWNTQEELDAMTYTSASALIRQITGK